jgi:hypothetical protein
MTIRKRSALLLGVLGFLSGIVFAQYQRRRLLAPFQNAGTSVLPRNKALPQVPMQVVDETMATARQQRKKSDYTMH